MSKLQGKVAVVAAGNSGIGLATAERSNGQIRELRKENLNIDTYRLVCILDIE
jgi:NADP-dependent 3-hydroxy acid dehydrogenase YdfG